MIIPERLEWDPSLAKQARAERERALMDANRDAYFNQVWFREDSPKNKERINTIHIVVRGAPGTPMDGGLYYAVMDIPDDYPSSCPKDVILRTPNGKFSVDLEDRMCINFTVSRRTQWTPNMTILHLLLSLAAFINDSKNASHATQQLAVKSLEWNKKNIPLFADVFKTELARLAKEGKGPIIEPAEIEIEPAETEPAETEPAEIEPAETEPAETEPAETEPAEIVIEPDEDKETGISCARRTDIVVIPELLKSQLRDIQKHLAVYYAQVEQLDVSSRGQDPYAHTVIARAPPLRTDIPNKVSDRLIHKKTRQRGGGGGCAPWIASGLVIVLFSAFFGHG